MEDVEQCPSAEQIQSAATHLHETADYAVLAELLERKVQWHLAKLEKPFNRDVAIAAAAARGETLSDYQLSGAASISAALGRFIDYGPMMNSAQALLGLYQLFDQTEAVAEWETKIADFEQRFSA